MADGTLMRKAVREVLSESIEVLVDFTIALVEDEIAQGGEYFHQYRTWLRRNLPPPHINELGKRHLSETLMAWMSQDHASEFAPWTAWQQALREVPDRQGYRSYLEPGELSLFYPTPYPLDLVAEEFCAQLSAGGEREPRSEIAQLHTEAFADLCDQCSLTPPMQCVFPDRPVVRDPSLPLEQDYQYWAAKYAPRRQMVYNMSDISSARKPEWSLQLMGQMAPDFPYSPELSSRNQLVFMGEESGPVGWALIIEKRDKRTEFHYPPMLVLVQRKKKGKLKPEDIIFNNVIGRELFHGMTLSPRALEVELRFHLPRARKLIAFYRPFIDAALHRVT